MNNKKEITKEQLTEFLGIPSELNGMLDRGIKALLDSINENVTKNEKEKETKQS